MTMHIEDVEIKGSMNRRPCEKDVKLEFNLPAME